MQYNHNQQRPLYEYQGYPIDHIHPHSHSHPYPPNPINRIPEFRPLESGASSSISTNSYPNQLGIHSHLPPPAISSTHQGNPTCTAVNSSPRNASNSNSNTSSGNPARKRTSKACENCRIRRTKCSGGSPCQACRDIGLSSSCMVRVKARPNRALPRLVAENAGPGLGSTSIGYDRRKEHARFVQGVQERLENWAAGKGVILDLTLPTYSPLSHLLNTPLPDLPPLTDESPIYLSSFLKAHASYLDFLRPQRIHEYYHRYKSSTNGDHGLKPDELALLFACLAVGSWREWSLAAALAGLDINGTGEGVIGGGHEPIVKVSASANPLGMNIGTTFSNNNNNNNNNSNNTSPPSSGVGTGNGVASGSYNYNFYNNDTKSTLTSPTINTQCNSHSQIERVLGVQGGPGLTYWDPPIQSDTIVKEEYPPFTTNTSLSSNNQNQGSITTIDNTTFSSSPNRRFSVPASFPNTNDTPSIQGRGTSHQQISQPNLPPSHSQQPLTPPIIKRTLSDHILDQSWLSSDTISPTRIDYSYFRNSLNQLDMWRGASPIAIYALHVLHIFTQAVGGPMETRSIVERIAHQVNRLGIAQDHSRMIKGQEIESMGQRYDRLFYVSLHKDSWLAAVVSAPPYILHNEFSPSFPVSASTRDMQNGIDVYPFLVNLTLLENEIISKIHSTHSPPSGGGGGMGMVEFDEHLMLEYEGRLAVWVKEFREEQDRVARPVVYAFTDVRYSWLRLLLRAPLIEHPTLSLSSLSTLARAVTSLLNSYHLLSSTTSHFHTSWAEARRISTSAQIVAVCYIEREFNRTEAEGLFSIAVGLLRKMTPGCAAAGIALERFEKVLDLLGMSPVTPETVNAELIEPDEAMFDYSAVTPNSSGSTTLPLPILAGGSIPLQLQLQPHQQQLQQQQQQQNQQNQCQSQVQQDYQTLQPSHLQHQTQYQNQHHQQHSQQQQQPQQQFQNYQVPAGDWFANQNQLFFNP